MAVLWVGAISSFGALREAPAPKDYLVDTWRLDDDLPRDGINSIAQGEDGYLWVSSRYGLARFDGVRFVNFSSRTGAQFVGHHFADPKSDPFGNVWISTPGGGVARGRGGSLRLHLPPGAPEIGPVFAGLTNA